MLDAVNALGYYTWRRADCELNDAAVTVSDANSTSSANKATQVKPKTPFALT